jgi:hypothetical protein
MNDGLEFRGVPEFNNALRLLEQRMDRAAERALIEGGETGVRMMRAAANTGSHSPGEPTSATPGQGPNRVTGNLLENIDFTSVHPTVGGGKELLVGVARGAPYAVPLEKGHFGIRYPFIARALEQLRALMPQKFGGSWARAVRGA